MSKECVEQVEGAGASVPMTDISNIDVPEGTDELSRSTRRAWRDRLNDASSRKMALGVLATLVGGSFWGFSGTSASFLFDTYHVDTLWLMSVRQILAGLLFMAVVVTRDRERLVKLWTTPADRRQLLLFTAFGLLFNQFCYLSAVRLTNAGTATVLQCLQLIIIMGYTCVVDRRRPRVREAIGIGLALGGTFLIATGGDPTSLSISPLGLVAGLMSRVRLCSRRASFRVLSFALGRICRRSMLPVSRRSRCSWSSVRFLPTCSICRALRTLARSAQASSEPWSRSRRPSRVPLCWARCFCRPILSALP